MIYNSENFPELPHSWTSLSVDDSVDSAGNSNKKLKSKDSLEHGRFPVIDQGQSDISGYSDDENLVVEASESNPVILFGDHTRLLKQISQPFVPGADGTKLFRAKSFWDARFVYQMLRAVKLPDKGYARHFQYLRDSVLPLPPLPEQKRIADKLDAVLARVDACRDRLDRVPAILKRFRQSVLAAATSGKLTEEWRGTLETIGWNTMSLADICLSVTDGDHQAPPQAETGIPFITIAAINDGHLRLEKASRFVPSPYFEALKDSRRPQRGDILFSVTGSIAIPAQVDTDEAFTFQRHIAILKPDYSKVSSLYLKFALGTESLKKQALDVATGTAQLTIPLTGLRSFKIDVPPQKEQTEIVRRVESLFAYADRLEARYASGRAQTERLTPSLLAKAFRGELVPQDPNDEPASALLERVSVSKNEGLTVRKRIGSTKI